MCIIIVLLPYGLVIIKRTEKIKIKLLNAYSKLYIHIRVLYVNIIYLLIILSNSTVKDLSFGFISYVKNTCSWFGKWVGFGILIYYTMAYFSLRVTPEGTIESVVGKLMTVPLDAIIYFF